MIGFANNQFISYSTTPELKPSQTLDSRAKVVNHRLNITPHTSFRILRACLDNKPIFSSGIFLLPQLGFFQKQDSLFPSQRFAFAHWRDLKRDK